MGARGRAILSAILWGTTILVFAWHVAGIVRSSGVPIAGNDFPAFYCAGKALLAESDPYAVEPLRACEHALPHGSDLPQQYVTPAPLPPYALGLFAMLAQLPYKLAAWIMFAVLAISCVWLSYALARVTQFPSGAIACSLLMSAGFASVAFGQLPPLIALAVVLCGAALLRGNDALAAICAAVATVEPHVGLPVALSLFFLRPRTRLWLVSLGLLCAAASVFAVSPRGTLEYFVTVLPSHARAELFAVDQFSLSHVLALAGAGDRLAVLLGSLSYLLTLVLGVVAANAASRRLDDAAIAYVPAATALLAGTFVHQIQLVAALPIAFLCIARGTPFVAWTGRLLVAVVAAVPFTVAMEHRPMLDVLALVAAGGALIGCVPLGETLDFVPTLGGFVLAAACVAFSVGLQHVQLPTLPTRAAASVLPAESNDASDNWGAFLRSDPQYAIPELDAEASKVPVWLGLAGVLVAALGMATRRVGPKTQAAWDSRPRIHLTT